MSPFKIFLFLAAAATAAYSQTATCTANAAVVPTVPSQGEAEALGDLVLTCTGGTEGASSLIQVTLVLNTNITSRTFATTPVTSEALLMIDDPAPGVVNMSNGFPYNGQVRGTPGVAAGQTGSGNVYLGQPASATSVTWTGVPFVAPGPSGTRLLRLTNLRANATTVSVDPFGLAPISAVVSATVPVNNPDAILAFASSGFTFTSAIGPASTATLTFTENFSMAFLRRVQMAPGGGPFSAARQDVPGVVYQTESQLTPCFSFGNCSTPPSSPIGLANTGTLLLLRISGLGAAAASLSAPNQSTVAATGAEAYLIAGGKPVMSSGNTSLPVSKGSVEFYYEVTAASVFQIDSFPIPVTLLDSTGAPLAFPAGAVFAGYLGPLNSTGTASPTAPEPRFVP